MSDDENSDADYLEDFNDYYMDDSYDVENHRSHIIDDPEHYEVDVYSADMVNELFDNIALSVSKTVQISPYLAKMLLYKNDWIVEKVISQYENNKSYFVQFYVKTYTTPATRKEFTSSECRLICPVCMNFVKVEEMCGLNCEHWFCKSCWVLHAKTKISQGCSVEISCMDSKCDVLVLEDFILSLQLNSQTLAQYRKFMFQNFVKVHPLLTFCVGPNCNIIFKVNEVLAKRVTCSNCNVTFCFKCGDKYHAPTECDTIKKWLTKCKDDSETANYFIAHTKDCPRCSICIEKNGGCNHMQCYKCKHDFCWMCLGDWKLHGSEYYECSRYKENPDTANETAKARAALKKYLHYYERWHNHAKSLKLEEQTLEKIKLRIHKKVMNSSGTWIDWQYLLDAAALLAKCRYTLQYTYPFAFYMKQEPRKDLFEYQQAQLEAEIENLSWKIERAETTDRGDLENQMYIAEKRRKMLLRDFLKP